jgi:hypothetical protein
MLRNVQYCTVPGTVVCWRLRQCKPEYVNTDRNTTTESNRHYNSHLPADSSVKIRSLIATLHYITLHYTGIASQVIQYSTMERNASPVSNSGSLGVSSPPSSPVPEDVAARTELGLKKKPRKKRKTTAALDDAVDADQAPIRKPKKPKARRKVSC